MSILGAPITDSVQTQPAQPAWLASCLVAGNWNNIPGAGKMGDDSGHANYTTATGVNVATLSSGAKKGTFPRTNGTGYGLVYDAVALQNLTPLSLAAWVYPTSYAGGNVMRILARDNGTCYNALCMDSAMIEYRRVWSGGRVDWDTANTFIQLNTWQFVGITYNGASTANVPIAYYNGTSAAMTGATPTGTLTADASGGSWIVGNGDRSDYDQGFAGDIGQYWILNAVMPAGWWAMMFKETRGSYGV